MTQATVKSTSDLLPEFYPYRDIGCEMSPSCLDCPLPQCKYDNPGSMQREKRSERDRQIVYAFRQDSMTAPKVAARFDLSQRTIFRILRRYQDEIDAGMGERMEEMAIAA